MNVLTERRIVFAARWTGRTLSALLLWLALALVIGHLNSNGECNRIGNRAAHAVEPNPLRETALGTALFTTLAGLALAWRWEGLGGLLIVGGFTAFAVVNGSRTFILNPFNLMLVSLVAGLLFLFCWWRTRKTAGQSPCA